MNYIKQKIRKYISAVFVSTKSIKHTIDVKDLPMGYYKTFGNKNPDKIFYVIWLDIGSGFFSNVASVLCHLKIAHDSGMIPVVDFKNFKTLYNEKELINDTTNAWEYYFKPVSKFTLNEVYQSKNVFFSTGKYPPSMSSSMTQNQGLARIYRKYVFLRKDVQNKIDEYLDKFNFKEKVLGIHFRGHEQKLAAGHSFPPTENQMIRCTDEILKKYKIEKIFIVTEDQDYLDLFIKKYGNKVLYTDSFRTRKVNAYNLYPRETHKYLLGLEVLVDAFLLSECNGLLCGDSNVSEFARLINNKFEFVYMINNGVNSSNPLIARYMYSLKKILPPYLGGLSNKIKVIKNTR